MNLSTSAYSSSCCWYSCDNLSLYWLTILFIEGWRETRAALGLGSGPISYNSTEEQLDSSQAWSHTSRDAESLSQHACK